MGTICFNFLYYFKFNKFCLLRVEGTKTSIKTIYEAMILEPFFLFTLLFILLHILLYVWKKLWSQIFIFNDLKYFFSYRIFHLGLRIQTLCRSYFSFPWPRNNEKTLFFWWTWNVWGKLLEVFIRQIQINIHTCI